MSPPEEAIGEEDPARDPRSPCWCCGSERDPDFFQPTCGCTQTLCVRRGHSAEICRTCCTELGGCGQPQEFDEWDDEDLGWDEADAAR